MNAIQRLHLISLTFIFANCNPSQAVEPAKPLPGYGEPAALVILATNYQTLADPESVIKPSLNFARILALGHYRVRVLVGHDGTEAGRNREKDVRESVVKINLELMDINQQRVGRSVSQGDGGRSRSLSKIEMIYDVFQNEQALHEQMEVWMSDRFTGDKRAPFGIVSFRGHGEKRDDYGDIFLTPLDSAGSGGYSFSRFVNLAKSRRASILTIWDMCRTEEDLEKPPSLVIERKENLTNSQPAKVGPTDDISLSQIVEKMRGARLRAYYPHVSQSNVFFARTDSAPLPDITDTSLLNALSIGLASMEADGGEVLALKAKDFDRAASSNTEANLREVFEFARTTVEEITDSTICPRQWVGPIQQSMIVYSIREDWVYEPIHTNIIFNARLQSNQTLPARPYGNHFVVERSELGYVGAAWSKLLFSRDPINAVQAEFHGSIEGHVLENENQWLEVLVSIDPRLKSVTFLLQPNGDGWKKNDAQENGPFLSTHCGKKKTVSGAGIHRISIPLDLATFDGKFPKNRMFDLAVSAPVIEDGPGSIFPIDDSLAEAKQKEKDKLFNKNWNDDVKLHIHAASIISDAEVKLDGPVEDLSVLSQYYFTTIQSEIIDHWWCDDLLRSQKDVRVAKSAQSKRGKLMQSFKISGMNQKDEYSAGVEGAISPPVYIDSDSHELLISIRNSSENRMTGVGKVGIVGYDAMGVLLEGEASCRQSKNLLRFSFADDGYLHSLSMILSDCDSITVESIRVVPKRAPISPPNL